jgi:hypothetical protein
MTVSGSIQAAASVAILFSITISFSADLGTEPKERASPTLPFDMSERQRQALAAMPRVEVSYHRRETVRLIEGHTGITLNKSTRTTQG